MACVCGHPFGDHREIGCMAKGYDDEFCDCQLYEEADPDLPDEDEGSDR